MSQERILVVEDEPGVLTLMQEVLGRMAEGFEVIGAPGAREAREAIRDRRPHLVLLDLNLERRFDGLEICRAIRADRETRDIAVIILSGELLESAETMLLDAGADDYIRKPQFTPKLLESRVRAVLRRTRRRTGKPLSHGPLVLNSARREAIVEGSNIRLTPTEFDILYKLANSSDRALDRSELLDRGGSRGVVLRRTVDVHVLSIRRKLGPYDWLVETVFGIGYRLGSSGASQVR